MTLIIAPTHDIARHVARSFDLPHTGWRFVRSFEDVQGYRGCDLLVYFGRDDHRCSREQIVLAVHAEDHGLVKRHVLESELV